MTTYDLRQGTVLGERITTNQVRVHVLTAEWDARDYPVLAGDIIKLLSLTERQQVLGVHVEIVRVEGAVATFDVGDSAGATQYHSNVDANALAQAVSATTAYKLYGADDDIRLTADSNMSNVKVVLKANVIDFANDLQVYEAKEDANI